MSVSSHILSVFQTVTGIHRLSFFIPITVVHIVCCAYHISGVTTKFCSASITVVFSYLIRHIPAYYHFKLHCVYIYYVCVPFHFHGARIIIIVICLKPDVIYVMCVTVWFTEQEYISPVSYHNFHGLPSFKSIQLLNENIGRFGKAILNELFCVFDIGENRFSLFCYILHCIHITSNVLFPFVNTSRKVV